MTRIIQSALTALIIGWAGVAAAAQTPPKMKMTTLIPPQITTPDTVETSLGTPRFTDGLPDEDTVQKVYDNLDHRTRSRPLKSHPLLQARMILRSLNHQH